MNTRPLVVVSFLISFFFSSCSFSVKEDSVKSSKDTTYIIDIDGTTKEEAATLSSIQGVLAKKGYHIYLKKPEDFWERTFRKQSQTNIKTIYSIDSFTYLFKKHLESYVLCDSGNIALAATVAGPMDAFIMTVNTAKRFSCLKEGSTLVYDVRGKDEEWLYGYVRKNLKKYNLNAITQHNANNPAALIDFAIANNYLCIVCQDRPDLIRKFYELIQPNSPKYGFGTPYHNERKDVSLGAEYGLYTVPAANTWNLSFFSSFEAEEKQQPAEHFPQKTNKENVHRVMIMMSDGDNLNWTINGCLSNPRYMGDERCGNYPINWMYPPEMLNVAGYVHNHYMRHRPRYNYLLGAVSGQGYTYPSRQKNLDAFCQKTKDYYEKAGLDYSVIMDVEDFETEEKAVLSEIVTRNPEIKGLYYMDYGNYAKWKGASYLIGETPVHSFRYRLWLPMSPLEEVAEKINSSSTDPHNLDAYSSVVVHVWSYGMEDVLRFIGMLDEDVILVNAEEFMTALKENVLK